VDRADRSPAVAAPKALGTATVRERGT